MGFQLPRCPGAHQTSSRLIALLFLVLSTILVAAPSAPAALHIQNPRCEFRTDPLGVDSAQPRLSWMLESEDQNQRQSAYRILAASSPDHLKPGDADLWDSGVVKSDDTLQVPYAGKPLHSSKQVFWTVQVTDAQETASAWSAPARWTMGIVNDADWKGSWIGAPAQLQAATLALRHQFQVKPRLQRALIHICGLGQYDLSLNGNPASEDLLTPGWTKYDRTCLYDTYDVTALLKPGNNAVALILGNGMYNVTGGRYTKFKGSFGPLKAIAQLQLQYADGSVEIIGTDEHWKCAAGQITFSCVYGGEDYDARLSPHGWNRPDFDDASWAPAVQVAGPGGKLRGLSCAAPPIRAFDVFNPTKITEIKPGVCVYDLGQNASMMPRLTVAGPAGSIVRITPAELLKPDGSVDRSSVGGGQAYWQYTLDDSGKQTWFPKFYYHGCRYLQVERTAPNGGELPTIDSLQGVVVHSASEPAGDFSCSSDLFNRIHTLVRWAQLSNMVSVLTDCPHRERLGWLEQDYLNGASLRYNFNLAPFFTKVMNDIADSQTPDGLVPDIAPEYTVFSGGFRDSPEWGSAIIQVAWQQYQFDGDLSVLQVHYPAMKRYAAYLAGKSKDNLLNFGLGDWYDLGPARPGKAQLTPLSLTATAIFYSDIIDLQKIAALLGFDEDARNFGQQAEKIRASFNRALFHPQSHTYATASQTANAMPLALGLVEPAEAGPVLDAIVNDIRQRGNGLTAGDVGYRYLLRALARGGRSDVIFDMNNQSDRPGYGYQLKRGATSLTEAWDARSGSQNHFMLGHIVEWFYHDLAGIGAEPDSPGFKKIVIKPSVVGDLTWVKASYNSVRGKINSEWRRDADRLTLQLTIPPNTTARVFIPTRDAGLVRERGQPISAAKDADFPGFGVYDIRSGHYVFTSFLSGDTLQIPAKP